MVQKLDTLRETPSQTAGPYVHIGCVPNFLGNKGIYPADLGASPVAKGARGEAITITGSVIDGAGMVLRDVMLESWQADAAGLFPSPHEKRGKADPKVSGWCRFAADFESGLFTLKTIKPGRVPHASGKPMAPHIALWIVARGINTGLQTRIYFDDEAKANAECPILARIEHRARVATLLAKRSGQGAYRFDIRLQGEAETVFFDL